MKHDAILINSSRGEIIDEDALFAALISNQIGGGGSSGSSIYKKMNINVIVINIALEYGIASLYYIIMTAFLENEYTPSKKRKHFYLGLILGCGIVWYFKPCKTWGLNLSFENL